MSELFSQLHRVVWQWQKNGDMPRWKLSHLPNAPMAHTSPIGGGDSTPSAGSGSYDAVANHPGNLVDSELTIRGNTPSNVFGAFGSDENTATFALSWVLARCPTFLAAFLADLGITNTVTAQIAAQKSGDDRGFTDMEIVAGTAAHIIVEAKVGWVLPTEAQLRRYLPRLAVTRSDHPTIVTVSAADRDYAGRNQASELDGVPVVHRSWGELHRLAKRSYAATQSIREKLWLEQLISALSEYRTMQQHSSNLVYIVALSRGRVRAENPYRWIDVVERDNAYFHPAGVNGWPAVAPNYIGFRYDGHLKAVRHVEKAELVKQPSDLNPAWSDEKVDHLVYSLGPAIVPAKPLPTGKVYANGRKWAAIDLLLSGVASSIHEAAELTKKREDSTRDL